MSHSPRRVGIAIVGLGGAVATTAIAGLELLRLGAVAADGLPLAGLTVDGVPIEEATGLVGYDDLVVGGWDLDGSDLVQGRASSTACSTPASWPQAEPLLSTITPWPAAGDADFCRNVTGGNVVLAEGRRAQVDAVRADLRRFREPSSSSTAWCCSTSPRPSAGPTRRRPACRRRRPSRPASTPTTGRSPRRCSTPTRRSCEGVRLRQLHAVPGRRRAGAGASSPSSAASRSRARTARPARR